MHQEGRGRQLHFIGLNPFAQELRCPAHHQANQEYCQDGEDDEVDEPHAFTAEDHIEHHQRKGGDAGHRRQAIVHGVDGAGGKSGRGCHEERCPSLTEPHFLALHIALSGTTPTLSHKRIPLHLADIGDPQEDQQERCHDDEEYPGLLLSAQHASQHVDDRGGQQGHQQVLEEVGHGIGVLERMGGVGVEPAAAVGPQVLDRDQRAPRDHARSVRCPCEWTMAPALLSAISWARRCGCRRERSIQSIDRLGAGERGRHPQPH